MATTRAKILYKSIKRNENKKRQFVEFMAKFISSGAAELVPYPQEMEKFFYQYLVCTTPKKQIKSGEFF
jgi:hypothetical protein